MENIIYHSETIRNCFKELKLGMFLSDVHLKHLMSIVTSVFIQGYNGKTVNFEKFSQSGFIIFIYNSAKNGISLNSIIQKVA